MRSIFGGTRLENLWQLWELQLINFGLIHSTRNEASLKEIPWDLTQGAQGRHQMGRNENSAILEHAWSQLMPPNTVGGGRPVWLTRPATLQLYSSKRLCTSAFQNQNWLTEMRASPSQTAGDWFWAMSPQWQATLTPCHARQPMIKQWTLPSVWRFVH